MNKNPWKLYISGREVFNGTLVELIWHVVENDVNVQEMAIYRLTPDGWIMEDWTSAQRDEDAQAPKGVLPIRDKELDVTLSFNIYDDDSTTVNAHAALAQPLRRPETTWQGPTHEYKVVEVNAGIDEFNELGRLGWRAVTTIRMGADFILMIRTSPERNNFAKVFGSHR